MTQTLDYGVKVKRDKWKHVLKIIPSTAFSLIGYGYAGLIVARSMQAPALLWLPVWGLFVPVALALLAIGVSGLILLLIDRADVREEGRRLGRQREMEWATILPPLAAPSEARR